jgi:hypothetical protein
MKNRKTEKNRSSMKPENKKTVISEFKQCSLLPFNSRKTDG